MFSKFHQLFDALNGKERQIFQGAALVFAAALILNGANIFFETTILAPVQGGRYTEGIVGQPMAINPVISLNNEADRDLMELVFRDLGELIKEPRLSDDRRTITIELKEGLFWSDGESLTGDDVLFTLSAIKNPDANSPLFQSWQNVGLEKINENELRFTLKTAYAFFLDNLKGLKIAPRHIFGAIPAANLRISDYNLEPVGNGPYAFAGYKKRRDGFITEYRFTANEFYAGEKALIEEFRIKFYPDYEEAFRAFNRKEIDGLGGFSAAAISELKIGHQIQEISLPRYYAVFFNPGVKSVLKNKEVRQAFGLLTDREKIIDQALLGRAIKITGPLHPAIEGSGAGTGPLEKAFSPEAAKALLEKNGWRAAEDGVLSKKIASEELRLEFELVVPEIDFLVETAKILAADWEQIGIKLTPVFLNPAEIINDVIKTRNYEMILFGNILKNNPDIFSFWHSSERFYPGLNLALYENRVADELLESIRRNFNQAARLRDLNKLEQVITEDEPAIFLYSPSYLYASPKNLGGFNVKLVTAPSERLKDVGKWYLKTARIFK